MKPETQVIRRVCVESNPAYIEIRPHPDAPDALELHTEGAKSIEWFGAVSIAMSKEYAVELGKALIAAGS